jgi:exonuclease III
MVSLWFFLFFVLNVASCSAPSKAITSLKRNLKEFEASSSIDSTANVSRKLKSRFLDFERIFLKWGRRPADLNCAWAPSIPVDRRTDKSRLRIVSYNAEWLFLYGGSGNIKCPGTGCPWEDISNAQNHFTNTIELLTKLDGDIVHFNEVEDCRVLRVLMDLLPSNHGYRAYLVPGTDTMTGQNVGILTKIDPYRNLIRTDKRKRYPVKGSTCNIVSLETTFKRKKRKSMGVSKHYLTHFRIGSLKILLAGAHFIAHPNDKSRCSRREAQAAVLAEFISNESTLHGAEIIVTGDFNDHDRAVVGANGAIPLSSVLEILKNGANLQSAVSLIPDAISRFSSWHDINGNCIDDGRTEHSLIDHVLVSPSLASRISSVWIDHNTTSSCFKRMSDHWPIIVDFRT